MSRKMNYQQFQKEIKETLQEMLPEEYHIEIHKVVKNNNQELDSLNIMTESAKVSPNFYLQHYFQRYQDGEKIPELIAEMLHLYQQTWREGAMNLLNLDLSIDGCRDKIFLRLVSRERNEQSLEKRPFIPFLDMAITFQLLLYQFGDGIGSIAITNEFQKNWEISTKTLFQLAQSNTIRLFPKKICYMKEILQETLGETEFRQEFYGKNQGESEVVDPLVVSNEKGINGATVLLYPDCLMELSEYCDGDFYVLPSSIHEVLVVPARQNFVPEKLKRTVREVNNCCLQENEILSGHIYYYSTQDRILEIL